jgi:hypothetical protein
MRESMGGGGSTFKVMHTVMGCAEGGIRGSREARGKQRERAAHRTERGHGIRTSGG